MGPPGCAEPMRVALVVHSDSPWAPFYARHLRDRGHTVVVISFHPKSIPGIDVEYVGQRIADGTLPKTIYLRRVPVVRRILRRFRPDIVLATYVRSNGLVAALTKQSALVISTVGADHGWGVSRVLDRWFARWVCGRAECLHAVSPELFESLVASGVEPSRITIIPVGIDARLFTPCATPRDPGPPRILGTRKHYPVYDNETLVRALGLLHEEGFPFECRFAGKGPTLEAARRLARDLGLSGQVRFLGEVESTDVPALLRWADIYVSATLSDGAPSSLFEAMSCGVFPVVSDIRANRDWLVPDRTGILCRVGRPSDWARGIRSAWEDPERRKQAAPINRHLVETRCDMARGLVRMESLLRKALRLYRGESLPSEEETAPPFGHVSAPS